MTEMMELAVFGALIVGLFIWKRSQEPKLSRPQHESPPPSEGLPETSVADLQYGIGNRAGVQDRLEDMVRANGEPVARYRGGNNPYLPSRYTQDPEIEAVAAQITGVSPAPRTPSHYARF